MATNLTVNFIGKNHLSKTTAVASRDLKKLGQTAKNVGDTINRSLGAVGVGVGLAALTSALKNSVIGFEKAEIASRKLDSVLSSMGFKDSSDRVDAYAETLQNLLAVDADVIKATQTKLATFSALTSSVDIAGGAFDRATLAALDLAAAGFGSAETNAVQLGKALQDPIKGLTSLSKSGVTFTKEEKAKIKTLVESNQLLQAQETILKAVEVQVGGTAKAGASEMAKLQFIFDSMSDTIGEALLPAVEEFSAYLTSPKGKKTTKEIVDSFVAMVSAVKNVVSFLIQNADAVKAVITSVVFLKVSWAASTTAVKLYTIMTGNAVKATKLLRTALITTGVGAALVLLGQLAQGWLDADEAQENYFADPTAASGDFTIANWAKANKDKLLTDWDIDQYMALGYETYGAYLQGMYNAAMKSNAKSKAIADKEKALAKERRAAAIQQAKETADKVRAALDDKIQQMKSTAEKFRDAVNVSFGLFGEGENSVFNVDYFKGKLQRMVAAAKGFAQNLKQILKTPGSQSLVDELIAMGPVEGNIAAKALLASGSLKEIVGLKSSLYNTGAQAGAVQGTMGNATYEININKAVISAVDIIKEIKALEKSHGRKYLVN